MFNLIISQRPTELNHETTPFGSAKDWRAEWHASRNHQSWAIGAKNQPQGNQEIRWFPDTKLLRIRLTDTLAEQRMRELEAKTGVMILAGGPATGKYRVQSRFIEIPNVDFTARGTDAHAALVQAVTAMPRTLLLCLSLALPSFVAAAPCDLLPYANQCQGSNLWPVPSGWEADNNGDCQPQPQLVWRWAVNSPSLPFCSNNLGITKEEAGANCSASMVRAGWTGRIYDNEYGPSCGWFSGQFAASHTAHTIIPCRRTEFAIPDGSAPSGGIITAWLYTAACPIAGGGWGQTNGSTCPIVVKPSDGVCTARWTTSAKLALQKDPLDPDCDANSCVIDGACKLR